MSAAYDSMNSPLRSMRDVGHREVLNDAAHELDRCQTEAQFADWAVKWGAAFVARLKGYRAG